MYCQGRLNSRKNEFRKINAPIVTTETVSIQLKFDYSISIPRKKVSVLTVSIPLDTVTVLPVSIPLNNVSVFPISLCRNIYLVAPILSYDHLMFRLKQASVLTNGITHVQKITMS